MNKANWEFLRASSQRGKQRKNRRLLAETLERREMLTSFYFVDDDAAAGGDGTINNPFDTIQDAANVAVAGDIVEIRAGVYREQVSLPRSGTEDNPIIFRAFNGEDVTVTATDVLTGFTQTSETTDNNNVYVASLVGTGAEEENDPDGDGSLFNRHELTVFVDGELVQEAKSRNSANELDIETWDTYDSISGSTLTDNSRSVPFDSRIVGAFVHVRVNKFTLQRHRITAASGNTLTIDGTFTGGNGEFYLIHDARSLVDSPGEWYFSEETNQLFLWAPDGGVPENVEVKRRAEAFDTNGNDYLQFQGLTLVGGDIDTTGSGAGNNSNNLLIDDVHIVASDRAFGPDFGTTRTAITFDGDDNIIRNSTLEHIWSVGVRLGGEGNLVANNLFRDTAFNGGGSGGVSTRPSSVANLVSHNTFDRVGRAAITGTGGLQNIFQYNDFSNALLLTEDAGAFYFNATDLGNSVIRFNTIHDTSGSSSGGIYTDNEVVNLIIHNNIIYDTSPASLVHNTPSSFILDFNNTTFNSGVVFVGPFRSEQGAGFGSRFYNNTFRTLNSGLFTEPAPWEISNNFQTDNSADFVDASSGDFRLTASSGAIDSGVEIAGITDGFNGAAPDVGAIEFGDPLFDTGHDFTVTPPADRFVYDYDVIPFSNRSLDGGFENGLGGWLVASGAPEVVTDSVADYRGEGLGVFGDGALRLRPGDRVEQTFTGLQPNTSYTLSGLTRITGEVLQAEDAIRTPSSIPVTTYRGQRDVGEAGGRELRAGDELRFNGVDFGAGGALYNRLEVGLARATSNTQVEVFLDNTNGAPIASFSAEDPDNFDLHNITQGVLPSVAGTRDLILRFQGSGNLGLLDAVRLVNADTAEQAGFGVTGFNGSSSLVSQGVGGLDFGDVRTKLEFRTGPNSTTATVFLEKPAGSTYDAYFDGVTLAESALPENVVVDFNQTSFSYDAGVAFQGDLQPGPWELLSPQTSGDVSWTGPVGAYDAGPVSGVNALNQDFVLGSGAATLNHRVANGRWSVSINTSSPFSDLDNLQVRAEGQLVLSDIDRNAGQISTSTFEVDVIDGVLNLEFSDADEVDPAWALNHLSLTQLESFDAPLLSGDYNRDSTVNAADYTIFRDTLGLQVADRFGEADGDGSGSVDQADLGVFQQNFGDDVRPTAELIGPMLNNGSFEDLTGADPIPVNNRVIVNGGTATINGWTANTVRPGGFDDDNSAAASDGDEYAFSNANGELTLTSDAVAHTTASGDVFTLSFDVGSNRDNAHDYTAQLLFGGVARSLASFSDSTNVGVNGPRTYTFTYAADGADLGQEPVVVLSVVNNGGDAQTYIDNVRLGVASTNEAPTIDDAVFGVNEVVPVGAVVGVVPAADPEMVPLTYQITAGNVGGAFAINSGGEITVAAPLDSSTQPSYALTVEVSDGVLTATAVITINVAPMAPFVPIVSASPALGNGSFENISGGMPNEGSNRIAGTNTPVTIPGWSVAAGPQLVGFDDRFGFASSGVGSQYAFVNANGVLALSSAPVAGHTTSTGDVFRLSFNVGSNTGTNHTYSAALSFGGTSIPLANFFDNTNASTSGLRTYSFEYIATAGNAGFSPVIELGIVNSGSNSQAYIDEVVLEVSSASAPAVAAALAESSTPASPVVSSALAAFAFPAGDAEGSAAGLLAAEETQEAIFDNTLLLLAESGVAAAVAADGSTALALSSSDREDAYAEYSLEEDWADLAAGL